MLTIFFLKKKKKTSTLLLKSKQTSKQSKIGHKEVFIVRGSLQFTYFARTVFGNPTLTIRTLNSSRDFESFITVKILIHNFGPIEDAVLMPYLSVYSTL